MKKQLKLKLNLLFMLIVVFVFLFQNTFVYADLKSDYPGADIDDCTWHLTWFGGTKLASGKTISDCTYNDERGWYEYEQNGTSYVVLAGAHRDLIGSSDDRSTGEGYYREWIHYFEYFDTISFKLDGEVYNGIILDCCGAAMRVEEGKSQILDVYTCADEDSYSGKMRQYSGATVEVSDTGTFSSKAGTSSSVSKRKFKKASNSSYFFSNWGFLYETNKFNCNRL